MPVRFTRFLLMVLLLVVPLQGVAAAVRALACTPHSGEAAASLHDDHAMHDRHASHDHGPPHGHSGDSDSTADHPAYQCCHQFSTATAPSFGSAADGDLPVFQSSLSLLETLFFPEQPQRPPRG